MLLKIAGVCCTALIASQMFAQSNKLGRVDKQFLTTAAEEDMIEAHIGQMAQNRAESQAAKDFAQKLTQDHTAAYSELFALAQKDGESIPRGINTRRIATISRLGNLKGKSFDKAFARDEAAGHERALALFQREADHGANAGLKAYAEKQLAVLHTHLETAKQLEKSST